MIPGLTLKEAADSYMHQVPEVSDYIHRCLRTERWDGHVVLMVVDAAFTSIGLNYFRSVVPRVEQFRQEFVETGRVGRLEDLSDIDEKIVEHIWKNRRSWQMAKSVAAYLATTKKEKGFDDRQAFIYWAKNANLDKWQENPVGQINGVGINSYQYLRMMGGVDTVMPDKIVKRVIAEMLAKANVEMPATDIDFVRLVERIAPEVGYRAIALCWMTWMVQSEAGMSRMEKYKELLPKI
ncbi:MAG TPA: hypothetical protein VF366_02800 [Dehalococcoidia bacterium]